MKQMLLVWVVAATAALALPGMADAKRLGGGKPAGMQRDMPARTAPDAPTGKPATPQGAQAPAQQAAPAAAPGAAAAAAAPAKRSWLGPIAGLATGLGLAALLSHFGLGEGVATFLMLLLIGIAAIVLLRFVMRRFSPQPAAAMQRTSAPGSTQVAWPAAPAQPEVRAPEPVAQVAVAAEPPAAAPAVAKAFVPAAFDSSGFERAAKLIFIRMQAANDARDLDDLRSFTTPELFASLALDVQERGSATQHTEVLRVEAQVLDVAQEPTRQIVSVRFSGDVRESTPRPAEPAVPRGDLSSPAHPDLLRSAGGPVVPFDEVWHLVKPLDDSRSWAVAGIEPYGTASA